MTAAPPGLGVHGVTFIFDLLTPKVDRFVILSVDHSCQFAEKSLSKYRVHNIDNKRTDGRTDAQKTSCFRHSIRNKSENERISRWLRKMVTVAADGEARRAVGLLSDSLHDLHKDTCIAVAQLLTSSLVTCLL